LRAPLLAASSIVGAALLAGCSGPLSALEPRGPAGGSIATLWWVMLIGSALLFALVLAIFALVYLRPGWGSSVSPMRWIVLGGLVLPALVLIPLVGYALIAGERLLPLPGSSVPQVEAEAAQWAWTFRYPGHPGIVTHDELHIPAGVPVDVLISSRDVIHSLWIPQLAGKLDAIPGHVNRLRIQADQPGRYEGVCNQFCGLGHANMRFVVVADPPEEFNAAIQRAATAVKTEARTEAKTEARTDKAEKVKKP
jgi:cytochrome c oxidase subunit II